MLKLVLPKGSLEKQTYKLFEEADLPLEKEFRVYSPKIKDKRISEVKILRPQEIPKFVEEGYFDLGISGLDCIKEVDANVEILAELPYSKVSSKPVKMVVAVPQDSQTEKPQDIKPGSRITTEFPNLTRKYFEKLNIPVQVFYSYGATEAKVPEIMDVVVDLTETGETLKRNGLKIIGIILESTTKLIANKDSFNNEEKRKAILEIRTLLLGVVEARGRVLLSMNVSESMLDELIKALPAMKKPTISKLYKTDYYEVTTVVDKKNVNVLIPLLKELGAEDILEIPISKIVK
ncbi:MAG: ATP phosphoribosyltransferase [Actinomycetia bacterium]|nr:ATP phosphoribosyltransferase [Actinomycetes bacterium]